jgi:hypothetical protein
MKKKQAVSDSTLQRYWRKAVLAYHRNTCIICGLRKPDEELECHHIARRRIAFLRHDYRNGVPVCHECHKIAHTKKGEQIIARKHEFYEYLLDHENIRIKDWLQQTGQSRDEFLLGELKELKEVAQVDNY